MANVTQCFDMMMEKVTESSADKDKEVIRTIASGVNSLKSKKVWRGMLKSSMETVASLSCEQLEGGIARYNLRSTPTRQAAASRLESEFQKQSTDKKAMFPST